MKRFNLYINIMLLSGTIHIDGESFKIKLTVTYATRNCGACDCVSVSACRSKLLIVWKEEITFLHQLSCAQYCIHFLILGAKVKMFFFLLLVGNIA